jgi:hypothetical protein
MVDDTEDMRRAMLAEAAERMRRTMLAEAAERGPLSREDLTTLHGTVYDTQELQEVFTVHNFLAPFISCTRKSDGVKGSMQFQHHPRFYFDFLPT